MADIDYQRLNRALDRVKTRVFMGKNAAFLGSLMCSMDFEWAENIPTAATNGAKVMWNPQFFLNLKPETRETVLLHELWHPGMLHFIRLGSRDPKVWNWACDIWINNMLQRAGHSFVGIEWIWMNLDYDENATCEQIYDDLIAKGLTPPPSGGWNGQGGGDMQAPTTKEKQAAINAVVQAVTSAKMNGQAGSIPGEIQQVLKKFLAPIIPWQTVLYKFFNDMFEKNYSWKVRDRRFPSIYLPGMKPDGGKLEHLDYYLDVSGSVTDAQVMRFNSEVKYIKEQFNPGRLRLIQFGTKIQQVREFGEDDPFDEIVVVGRGGTNLTPVREMIERDKPTAAIIFSDLCCAPMQPLTRRIPIIWVCIGNPAATVPFGDQLIHIPE